MGKLDFHKVSQNADLEVYQSMQLLKTKEDVNGVVPRKYHPQTIKTINGSVLDDALESFKGYDIDSVQMSKNEGIVVRVHRTAGDDYEAPEPGVERLEVKGGDK